MRSVKFILSILLATGLLGLGLGLLVTPAGAAGITVWKMASSETIKAGEPFTYTIYVLNTTGNQINLVISDTVPSGANVVHTGGGTLTDGVMHWSVPAVNHGQTISTTFAVVVNRTGEVVNTDYRASSSPNSGSGNPVVTTIIPNDPSLVTITPVPSSTFVGDSATLTFMVSDAFGNPVADGTEITINFDRGTIDGQPAGTPVSAATSGGQVVKTLAGGTVAGVAHISATVGAAQTSTTVTFHPGPPSSLSVTTSAASIPANGNATTLITATVQDNYGNPVAQTPITFTSSLGQLNGGGPSAVLNTDNGQGVATLGGTVAGTAHLTVTVGTLIDISQSVYLAPGPPTRLSLSAAPSAITANGTSTSTLTLLILDEFNNQVDTTVSVSFTTSLGTLAGGGSSHSVTSNDGKLQVVLTSSMQAGTANILATALGLNTNIPVKFVPGPPALVTLNITPATIPADGSSMAVLTTMVRDAFGNPVDTPVEVTFSAGAGTILPDSSGTTLDGVITRSLRSSTILGTVPVTATAAGVSTPATESVQFVVGPPHLAEVTLTPASPITAGVPAALSLIVRDSAGHPVPGATVTMTTGLGNLAPSPVGVTDGNGRLERTLVSTRTGMDLIGVFAPQGVLNVTGGAITFVADAPVQANLTASPTQLFANGTNTALITATLRDQYGNLVPGVVPDFTTTLGNLLGNSATNSSGVATRTLRSTTELGRAVISMMGLPTVAKATVDFVTGPPAIALLNAQPATATANGTDMVTLVITVTDSVGHPLIGQTLAVTSSIGTISGSGPTDAQGVLVRSLSSTKSGQPQIYVAGVPVTGDPITFLPGPLHHINVTPYGSLSVPLSTSAGLSLSFSATGYDIYNNPVSGLSFLWSKASQGGDGLIGGSGIFTGTLAGLVQVRASAGGKNGISFVNVGPGAAAMTSIKANPLTLPADGTSASSLTFSVMDKYGNAVGAGIPLTVVSSIGLVEGLSPTDVNGVALRTIRSTQAGQAIISVTNLLTVTGEKVITFTPGSPKQAFISASPASLSANGAATSIVRIQLLDNFGNPVGAGYTPIIQVSSGTVSPSSGTTDANGVVTSTLTAPLVQGTANFTVKYFGIPLAISGDMVAFVVGPLDHVRVYPDGALDLVAGQPVTFTAQAYDEFNAPIPDGVTYGWNLEFNGLGRGEQSNFFGPEMTFTGTSAGTGVRLTAWAEKGSPYSESAVDITVLPGPPAAATLAFTPTTIIANGVSPITFTLTNLVDQYTNSAADGAVVTVTIQSAPVVRTNNGVVSNGTANIVLAATTQAGTYPISASSAAGAILLTGMSNVTFLPGPPAQAEVISATPPVIVADGVSTSLVALQLRDVFGNKVASGHSPVVSSTLGTILPGGGSTDSQGVLTRTLQAGLVLGQASLNVAGFATTGLKVPLIPGPPAMVTITVTSPTLAAGGTSTPVIFEVQDTWGHPVADGTLITPTLSPASYGTFMGQRQTTQGQVNQTLISGVSVGTATVGSEGLAVNGNTLVTFIPGPAAIACVEAQPTSLVVGETALITLTVTDAYSNTVPPTAITTTATLGTFEGGSSTLHQTTLSGTALFTANLTSTNAGTETLHLRGPAGPLALHPDSQVIQFLPDMPLIVTLNPAGTITATAGTTLTVTASSRDRYGNAVDPWLPIPYTWWQSAGPGSPGYGTLLAADPYSRAVYFKPTKVGSNQLWATGGVTTSYLLKLDIIAGSPATATVGISPSSVPAGGARSYTVTLTHITDAFGNPIPDGTPLTVTVSSAPPVIDVGTTSGGSFTKALSASTEAGTHPLTITGPGGPLTLSGQTSVTFTPGEPVYASVKATPTELPADGTSTATLVITLRDSYANLVANDLPITVTASSGTILGTGSTTSGRITRTLRAPVALNTATFTVRGPNGPLLVSGDTVEFVPGAPAQALLIATPAKLLADGISTSAITITIKDGYGFTIPGSGPVLLTVERGSIIPTNTLASAGSFTSTFVATTSVGLAGLAVTYNGTPLPLVGDTLELVPGPAVSATLSATPLNLAVGTEQRATLRITLTDAWGRPVANGTAVTITTSLGTILSNSTSTVSGVVTRVLTPGLTIGTATFTLTTAAGILSPAGDKVNITPGNLHRIDLLPGGPAQVSAGSKVTFTAIGYDKYNNKTGTGQFNWQAWPGTGYGTLATNGVFTGTIAGTVGIQASQGTVYSAIKDVTVVPGSPITALVSASPRSLPLGGAASLLTITARDAFGNLIADGTTLKVTSNLGTVTGSTTSRNGVLTRTLISGSYYGQATIFINGFEAGGDKVSFIPRSRVTAYPGSLYADGLSKTTLTIDLFNISGAAVADGTVPVITTSLGTLSGSGGTIAGKLTRTLKASLTPGTAKIFVNGLQAEGGVPFLLGPASTAHIKANPPWLLADGKSRSTLVITVQDAYGHVITGAGAISVTTSRGTISGSAPTVKGVTTRVLTASTQSGAAVISVAGLTTTGDAKIHFVGSSLHNGDFESGGLNNWSIGRVATPTGATPAYSATTLSSDQVGGITVIPPQGTTMIRLGAVTSDKSHHQLSEAWLSQPVYILPDGLTQVTFRYRILSYDVSVGSPNNGYKEWDPFEVYLNGQEVFQDGFRWTTEWENWYHSSPASPKDTGWKQGVLDLTPHAGQVVVLEFRVPNRQAPRDNTWVYLDNMTLAFREETTSQIFLPLLKK